LAAVVITLWAKSHAAAHHLILPQESTSEARGSKEIMAPIVVILPNIYRFEIFALVARPYNQHLP